MTSEGKRIHLIGIGGISMSGIARILVHRGYEVSGSDMKDNHLLDHLRIIGVEVSIGHSIENVRGADMVVISNAIPEKNEELKYARDNNIPVIKRAQMIARLMKEKKGIAVSGTHGKTTTTSMLSFLLTKAGLDPTIMLGGELDKIGGNVRIGNGDYFLTEADESDGSLLYFDPKIVVVTNAELDHLDYYDSKDKLLNTFQDFISDIPEDGQAILCAEDDELMNLVTDQERTLTYGYTKGDIRAKEVNILPFGSFFTAYYHGKKLGEIKLQVPGKHNVLNALANIAVAMFLGLSFTVIKNALESYSGVKRRFEKKGLIGDILVIDDYAHHPTEIRATLNAASNTGYERIVAVFQPHRYTRTKHLLADFSRSFELVDHLIVTDIYSAGEEPIEGVNSGKLVNMIAKNSDIKVDYIKELSDIADYLQKIMKSRDLILTIGAGDVYRVGEMLIEKMKKRREMA